MKPFKTTLKNMFYLFSHRPPCCCCLVVANWVWKFLPNSFLN